MSLISLSDCLSSLSLKGTHIRIVVIVIILSDSPSLLFDLKSTVVMYRGKNLYVMLTEYILCTVYSEKMTHALIYHVITNIGGVIKI